MFSADTEKIMPCDARASDWSDMSAKPKYTYHWPPPEARRKDSLPQRPEKELGPAYTPNWNSGLQKCERTLFCYFQPPRLCGLL